MGSIFYPSMGSLSATNKLHIRCAWEGNPAFDDMYLSWWAPGSCP